MPEGFGSRGCGEESSQERECNFDGPSDPIARAPLHPASTDRVRRAVPSPPRAGMRVVSDSESRESRDTAFACLY